MTADPMYATQDEKKANTFIKKLDKATTGIFDQSKVTANELFAQGIKVPDWLTPEFIIIDHVENPAIKSNKVLIIPVDSYLEFIRTGFINIRPDAKYNSVVIVTGTA